MYPWLWLSEQTGWAISSHMCAVPVLPAQVAGRLSWSEQTRELAHHSVSCMLCSFHRGDNDTWGRDSPPGPKRESLRSHGVWE